jgi:hypothetical protein
VALPSFGSMRIAIERTRWIRFTCWVQLDSLRRRHGAFPLQRSVASLGEQRGPAIGAHKERSERRTEAFAAIACRLRRDQEVSTVLSAATTRRLCCCRS